MENIDQSLIDMKEYILKDSIIQNINNPEYEYYICVYANTIYTLYLAARLIRSLDIRAKSIGRMQSIYKSCNLDCIDIAEAFKDIKNTDDYNVNIITIFDTHVDDRDFYITIISHKKNSEENNNIAIGIDWKQFL